MRHTGIDLHERDPTVTTVDAAGQPVKTARLRATPATRAAVTPYFAALGADASERRAVVESTSTGYRLADFVRERGVGRTLGHGEYLTAIRSAKVKTDAVDAASRARHPTGGATAVALMGTGSVMPSPTSGTARGEPVMGYGRRRVRPPPRC